MATRYQASIIAHLYPMLQYSFRLPTGFLRS